MYKECPGLLAYSLRIKCLFLPWLQSPAKPDHLLLILPHTSYLHLLCEAENWPSIVSAIWCSWFAQGHTLFPSPSVHLRPCTWVLSEDLGHCLQGDPQGPRSLFSLFWAVHKGHSGDSRGCVWFVGRSSGFVLILSIFTFTLCACLHVSACVCVYTCAWHDPHVGPRDWTLFIWFGSKHL